MDERLLDDYIKSATKDFDDIYFLLNEILNAQIKHSEMLNEIQETLGINNSHIDTKELELYTKLTKKLLTR